MLYLISFIIGGIFGFLAFSIFSINKNKDGN